MIYAVTTLPVSYRTLQSTLFDMIYFHGLGALSRELLGITHDSPDLRVQRRAPEPMLPMRLFGNPIFAVACTVSALTSIVMMTNAHYRDKEAAEAHK